VRQIGHLPSFYVFSQEFAKMWYL